MSANGSISNKKLSVPCTDIPFQFISDPPNVEGRDSLPPDCPDNGLSVNAWHPSGTRQGFPRACAACAACCNIHSPPEVSFPKVGGAVAVEANAVISAPGESAGGLFS
ncbi:unnamed protein product [Fusarium graminearum]|uniref:Uncharacterized protein n=1 Tax=Gibberella zeae TaxID=5518 RepID=A0A4E9ECU7_GIBZA|nr:unnamed protein product [Fusarium graminearum]CAG1994805.1 unnamed protein product [Fusarium graminearum]